jgi:hypothetical protein
VLPGRTVVVSDMSVELILNCALSKVPELVEPITQKLRVVPGVTAAKSAPVSSTQSWLYACTDIHCATITGVGLGEGEGVGDGDGDLVGVGLGLGEGVGLGLGLGVGDGDGDGLGEGDLVGLGEGDAVGVGLGLGVLTEKFSAQVMGVAVSAAFGLLSGTLGATATFRSW